LIGVGLAALPPIGSPQPPSLSPEAEEIRRAAHKTIELVSGDIEQFRFNRAVARIYELTNTLSGFKAETAADFWVARESREILVRMLNPMMPHLAEELWERLGHDRHLVFEDWPTADPALTRDTLITLAVQVNGKKRATIDVPVDADEPSVRETALADPAVLRSLAGKEPRRVIVVQNRIVNVVV
jgi:leucyl-tRNA synthetase